jgi:hypothetical protein
MTTVDQELIKTYLQCPKMLLYGRPDLAIQDKWALISLMGLCWRRTGVSLKELEGPYKLSLREISTITGVKHTALRRKEGKDPRDGVLDRLQAVGYVTVVDGKPIDQITGKEGRAQTYLYIHLEKIWIENSVFSEEGRLPENRQVSETSFKIISGVTVNVVNSPESPEIVNVVNSTVSYVNSDVNQGNSDVNVVNHTVNGASSNSAQYSNTLNTKENKETPAISPYLFSFIKKKISESASHSEDQVLEEDIAYVVDLWQRSHIPQLTFKQILVKSEEKTRGMGVVSMINDLTKRSAHVAKQIQQQEVLV